MRQAIAVGLMGLAIVAMPTPARSGTADGIGGAAGFGMVWMIACLTLGGSSSESADEDEYSRKGWLAGVAGSYAIDSFGGSSPRDSLGVNGRVGYRCLRHFSPEVEVEWLASFDDKFLDVDLGSGPLDAEPVVVTSNAKAYLLTGRYQPFVVVGGGPMITKFKTRSSGETVSDTKTEFAMRVGGGIDLYATKHVVVSLEVDYVRPIGDLRTLDYVSFGWGLQYRF